MARALGQASFSLSHTRYKIAPRFFPLILDFCRCPVRENWEPVLDLVGMQVF